MLRGGSFSSSFVRESLAASCISSHRARRVDLRNASNRHDETSDNLYLFDGAVGAANLDRLDLTITAVMKAVKGVLITCDAAVKQILLQMNERRRDEDRFVIEDLDQTHLLIKADGEENMRAELESELEKNTYSLEP